MATLPLFDRTAAAGCWHAVASPGGYECWTVDAVDPTHDTQLTAVLMEGLPQDVTYLHRYATYRHKPTRVPPPLPRNYVGVLLCVYRGGKLVYRGSTRADGLVASRERLDVQVGQSRLTRERLTITADGFRVDLALGAPPALPIERPILRFAPRIRHTWTAIAARCDARGAVGDAEFTGAASIEHAFGTAPAAIGVTRVIRGRVFADDDAMLFHMITPAVRKPVDEVTLLHASAGGVEALAVNRVDLDGAYVRQISLGGHLLLTDPKLVDTHGLGTRMTYTAAFAGKAGIAYCDVVYPRQPRLPMLASLVEWSIPLA